jgi:hypothetical protein
MNSSPHTERHTHVEAYTMPAICTPTVAIAMTVMFLGAGLSRYTNDPDHPASPPTPDANTSDSQQD